MNGSSYSSVVPQDVMFFIGPLGAPESRKKAYNNAVELAEAGDSSAIDRLLAIVEMALLDIAGRTPEEPSPLKDLLSTMLGREFTTLSTFVARGVLKGHRAPVLTIHLDRSLDMNGTPLGRLLQKSDGEMLANLLAGIFKADWIYTVWTFPGAVLEKSGIKVNRHVDPEDKGGST